MSSNLMAFNRKSIGSHSYSFRVETHGVRAHAVSIISPFGLAWLRRELWPAWKMINTPGDDGIFRKEDDRRRGRGRRWARCVCVITVTAPLPRRRAPRGISYDHPAASASLGTRDQTNRLPIALPIIGTIDTGARHHVSPDIDAGRSNGTAWPPSRRTNARTECLPRQDSRLFLARAITTDAIDLTAGVLTTGD